MVSLAPPCDCLLGDTITFSNVAIWGQLCSFCLKSALSWNVPSCTRAIWACPSCTWATGECPSYPMPMGNLGIPQICQVASGQLGICQGAHGQLRHPQHPHRLLRDQPPPFHRRIGAPVGSRELRLGNLLHEGLKHPPSRRRGYQGSTLSTHIGIQCRQFSEHLRTNRSFG